MSTKKNRLHKCWSTGFRTGYEYGKREEQMSMAYAVPTNNPYEDKGDSEAWSEGVQLGYDHGRQSQKYGSDEATHIDQMRRWWNDARRQEIKIGDQIIQNHPTAPDEFTIFIADEPNRDSGQYMRVLPDAL